MDEETYGTDWERLGRDEVLRRAYALGVAAGLGDAPDGELERLQGQVAGSYGRSLVELAYDEGRTRGREPRPEAGDEEVWSELVDGDLVVPEPPEHRHARPAPRRATDLPGSISPPTLLEIDRDDLARLGLPDFLR